MTPATTISGLDHLEGQTVTVVVDGYDINAEADLPRLVAGALRAEAWVAGFFGLGSIREHDDEEIVPGVRCCGAAICGWRPPR